MSIKEKIIKRYPLTKKVENNLDYYLLDKRRYLVFWESLVTKENVGEILNTIEAETNNSSFSKWKTVVVIGKTDDVFKKTELLYFNSVNLFVVFYLINEKDNRVFMNDSWIFVIGNNYKKHIKRIDSIMKSE